MRQPTLITDMIDAISELQQALNILEAVYHEFGPYGNGEISFETRMKMNNYFKFDDGE